MAYIIKKQDLADDKDFTSTFTHDKTGIRVTFYSALKPAFLRTHALIMAKKEQEQDTPLTADVIAKMNDDELNINEAMGYAIGEHLIADWDVRHGNHSPALNGSTDKRCAGGLSIALLS